MKYVDDNFRYVVYNLSLGPLWEGLQNSVR